MKKYTLELVVFISGMVVMILELVGSRILAPFVGTSLYVWTSLIGIILASLSIGYWLGGKIADRYPQYRVLSLIIFLAAVFITATAAVNSGVLAIIRSLITDIRLASVLAALILFTPASILLGMVSPFAARLKMTGIINAGTTVGSLSAVSAIGSIVGTFLAGFILISFLGSNNILFTLAAVLLLTSFVLEVRDYLSLKIALGIYLPYLAVSYNLLNQRMRNEGFIDVDTAYSRIWIVDTTYPPNQRPIKLMLINSESSSAQYLDSEELVFPYTNFYRLAQVFNPDFKHTLMIGGAGYSYPQYYLKNYHSADIDVVEIDPGVTTLARQYFGLKANPRLTIIHLDGRLYLNQTQKQYDVILGDAYRSYTVPYQLTTLEAVKRMYGQLASNGIVMINLIGSVEGDKGKFIRAEYRTFSQVFPYVYLFPVDNSIDGGQVQNIMLVAFKNQAQSSWQSDNLELQSYLSHKWIKPIANDVPVLTDSFAPIEYYTRNLL